MPSHLSILVTVALFFSSLIIVSAAAQGDAMAVAPPLNATASSLWRRRPGCWSQPWTCGDRHRPFRLNHLCCRNRCVDVWSDPNNCGLCGIRCPFSWSCCSGFCVDTMTSPFHCGDCAVQCPCGVSCFFGLCGYGEQLDPHPPFPFSHTLMPMSPTPIPPPPLRSGEQPSAPVSWD